jgi:hypothetical protein
MSARSCARALPGRDNLDSRHAFEARTSGRSPGLPGKARATEPCANPDNLDGLDARVCEQAPIGTSESLHGGLDALVVRASVGTASGESTPKGVRGPAGRLTSRPASGE